MSGTMRHIVMALAFTLLAPPLSSQGAPGVKDSLLATPAEYQGWKLYHSYCDRCHAQDAMGSTFAPDVRRSVSPEGLVTRDGFAAVVRDGRAAKGMPGFRTLLTDDQIADIYAYIKARSEGRLGRGRPHQATPP